MIFFIVPCAVVLFFVVVLVAASIVDATIGTAKEVDATEEKGPMPKNHGGFNQTVHGGKS